MPTSSSWGTTTTTSASRRRARAACATRPGIRQFVVGTGGKEQRPFGTIRPNSESRSSSAVGVLRLKLAADAYEWRFVPAVGTFTDAGVQSCH